MLSKVIGWYNEVRLHTASCFLRPVDYYRGNPKALHEACPEVTATGSVLYGGHNLDVLRRYIDDEDVDLDSPFNGLSNHRFKEFAMSVQPVLGKRGAALLSLFCLLVLSHGTAAEGAQPWHVVSPKERRIYEALNSQTDIQFVDTTLRNALKSIASRYDIEIVFDEQYLNREGISFDREIVNFQVKLPDLRLRQAFNIILMPKGLAFYVRDDGLIVTSALRTLRERPLRLYNVGSLLQKGETADELAATLQQLMYMKGGANAPAEDVEQYYFAPYRHFIFVKATLGGHKRIAKLLDLLETGLAQKEQSKE